MNPRHLLAGPLTAVLLAGCVAGARPFLPATFEREPGWVSVPEVAVLRQHGERDCGAAVVAMLLGFWGRPATEQEIRAASGEPPDHGLRAEFLRTYLRARGLEAFLFEGTLGDLERELDAGRPALIGVLRPLTSRSASAHYLLVIGLNRAQEQVVVIDPAEGLRVYPYGALARIWAPAHSLTMAVFLAPAAR